jgi:DNA-binding NarL/FixJ family response regulator
VIKLLIAEDHGVVRAGLQKLVATFEGVELVGTAADGAEAVDLCRETEPDVVLMDLVMPGVDGIEATRRIVASGSSTRVLVLTTFEGEELTFRALQAGAAGYLLKDAGGARLVSAVEAVAAGERPMAPEVVARLVASYVDRPPAPSGDPARLAPLSERERDVLALIGAGRSNAEIAAQLYISLATVKSHVRHILAKLDLRDRPQAIVLAHECGLVADGAPR